MHWPNQYFLYFIKSDQCSKSVTLKMKKSIIRYRTGIYSLLFFFFQFLRRNKTLFLLEAPHLAFQSEFYDTCMNFILSEPLWHFQYITLIDRCSNVPIFLCWMKWAFFVTLCLSNTGILKAKADRIFSCTSG